MSVSPKSPQLKTGVYGDEPGMFTDINSTFRYLLENHIRPSRTSPPIANDVKELSVVFDKTLLRLYTKVDGTLRYVQFV